MQKKIATGVLVQDKNKFLLIKKNRGAYSNGVWCVAGGKKEPNETIEQCGIREIKEETGLDVKIIKKICSQTNKTSVNNEIIEFYFTDFLAEKISGKEKPGDDAGELKWFSKEELKKLEYSEPTKIFLKKAGLL